MAEQDVAESDMGTGVGTPGGSCGFPSCVSGLSKPKPLDTNPREGPYGIRTCEPSLNRDASTVEELWDACEPRENKVRNDRVRHDAPCRGGAQTA
jgi:hypothetical protein